MKSGAWKASLPRAARIIIAIIAIIFFTLNVQATIPTQPAAKLKDIFIPVLCYHRIVPKASSVYDLTPAMLEKQLRFFIENGYRPITALQYLKLQKYPQFFPDKPVVLTFDDGSKGHFQYVLPLLQKYRIKATFFVYPGNIAEKDGPQMTWAELAQMAKAGMDIESHTMSHPFLTKTNLKPDDPVYLGWLDHELRDSRLILERRLKARVILLAYSYGWFNRVVEAKAVEAGYQAMFTVNWGVNLISENPLRLKRRVVSNRMSQLELARYLTSKPLSLEVISPADAAIVNRIPEVQFKLTHRELTFTDMVAGKDKAALKSDSQGIFRAGLKDIYRGYNTVTISGYNDRKQLFIGSWGFDYEPEAPKND